MESSWFILPHRRCGKLAIAFLFPMIPKGLPYRRFGESLFLSGTAGNQGNDFLREVVIVSHGSCAPPLFEAVHPLLFFALFRSGLKFPGKEGTGILQGRHHENFLRASDREKGGTGCLPDEKGIFSGKTECARFSRRMIASAVLPVVHCYKDKEALWNGNIFSLISTER